MSSNVRQLLENGVPIYPITEKSLVIGLQDAPFESYIVAWDGTAAPTVANVPAGVVINYSGTDYTGTLAASSSTAPYLYLVASASQQGEYDRYITTRSGSSFVWTALGSTAPVSPVIADDLVTNDSSKALSAKQGKILNDNLGQLDQKMNENLGVFNLTWELGNISISGTGWTYSASSKRVRMPQGETVHLIQGDVVGLASYDGYVFYIGWRRPNGTYGNVSAWQTADFIVTEEADYVFCLRKNPEATLDSASDVSSLFFIKTNRNYEAIMSKVFDYIFDVDGKDGTAISLDFDTKSGKKYRVMTPEPWKVTNAGGATTAAFLIRTKSGSTYTDLTETRVNVPNIASIAKFYEFMATTGVSNLYVRGDVGEKMRFMIAEIGEPSVVGDYIETKKNELSSVRGFVKGINHRGLNSEYPENTLPAYAGSKKAGFEWVETDVRFTSDGVPVLLHDVSINRTARNADGTELSETVNIADIAYEEALDYDFGIYKDAKFAGTKIPTFTQFIVLCRNLGLKVYIELKAGSKAQRDGLVDIVQQNGMLDNCTWISTADSYLADVTAKYAKARLGIVMSSVTAENIAKLQGIKTANNEVFADSQSRTSEEVALCKEANIPMEVWTFNNPAYIAELDAYISGVTSDYTDASTLFCEWALRSTNN